MRISDWSSDVCSSDLLGHICRFAYVDPELLVAGSNREIAVRRMKRLIGRIPRVRGTQLDRIAPCSEVLACLQSSDTQRASEHRRSEERRVRKECVGMSRSRGAPDQ